MAYLFGKLRDTHPQLPLDDGSFRKKSLKMANKSKKTIENFHTMKETDIDNW